MIGTTADVWRQERYGGPDVVHVERRPMSHPKPGEVLVRVDAVALNSADIRLMRGDPLLIRLGAGVRRPRQPVQGRDIAGVVAAAAADVTEFIVGDRVAGEISGGGLASAVSVPASKLVRVHADVDQSTAAALPLAGGTAWQALDLAAVRADSRLLVLGAGGGVGTFTVRLAALRGAEVHAVCHRRAASIVSDLGAERVDDRDMDLGALPAGSLDAIIDIAGRAPLRMLRRLLRDGGIVVGIAGGANHVTGPLGRMAGAAVVFRGSGRRFRPLVARPTPSITSRLLALAAEGHLRPVIGGVYAFSKAPEALTHIDRGLATGKVLVIPD